ncbi:hypothetical protein [Staphylococcus saprophyticus]|uniref:hypothetical protein n=1 Tax=Staphylococcus saprophyticus TaxID=29385 RepID=UPI00094BACF3|nr:hypothetical protein [Staphylococcus saprophyticus]MDW4454282.1 hypothetical protein [Staphylococcus saprophyticus]MEB5646259.1 hypothetical protein [Staphylococcus saprophyticus]OLN94775.1 hypothetical protein BMJ13_02200 [Staphylococcus saprophyticus]UUY78084.1 hypothetical protein NUT40_10110 [Staphylococcus saprophyticus]
MITSFPGEYDTEQEKGFLYSGENIELIFVNNSNYYCAQNFTVWHVVYHMVNNFVLDIKEYIENRSDEHG